jgi:hypothetical protein
MSDRARPCPARYFHVAHRRGPGQSRLCSRGDYRIFLAALTTEFAAAGARLVAYSLVADDWRLVAGPMTSSALAKLLRRVIDAHRRARRGRAGGADAFDLSPLPTPGALLGTCRDVERQAFAAGLVRRVADWPWCSLAARRRAAGATPLVWTPFLTSAMWRDYVQGASDDLPDPPRGLARRLELGQERRRVRRRAHDHESDAHVERPEHLPVVHAAGLLQPAEDGGRLPALAIE